MYPIKTLLFLNPVSFQMPWSPLTSRGSSYNIRLSSLAMNGDIAQGFVSSGEVAAALSIHSYPSENRRKRDSS